MPSRRNMALFYLSIALTIGSSVLYHFSQKQIPAGVNPIVSVIVTYAVSRIICIGLLYFAWPADGLWHAVISSTGPAMCWRCH